MKKTNTLALLLLIAAVAVINTGCSTVHERYKETGWYTPDSFNYTHSREDNGFKASEHYFGLSWTLK